VIRGVRIKATASRGPTKEDSMALSNSIIAIIARKHPAIWEIVGGGPAGPGGWAHIGARVALNPQPLPPGELAALNPQPLPPAARYGAAVGMELVRAASTAQLLRVAFEPGDDICPPPRTWPPIPFPFPPDPYPWRTADDFDVDYAMGLAFVLEASASAWSRLDGAGALERVHEVALKTAMAGMEGNG
jgi:hypothetical protein